MCETGCSAEVSKCEALFGVAFKNPAKKGRFINIPSNSLREGAVEILSLSFHRPGGCV